jgi:hypothetical protein
MHKWEAGGDLYLFTVDEFNKLPDGIELTSIMIGDKKKIKGKDEIDLDTRYGHIAYGVNNPWEHAEKHLFLTFILSQ